MKSLKGILNEGKMSNGKRVLQYEGVKRPERTISISEIGPRRAKLERELHGSGILETIAKITIPTALILILFLGPTGFGIIGTIFGIIPIWLVILMILVGIFLWRQR